VKCGRSSTMMHLDKSAYTFFPEYIQEKTHMPFLANQALEQWKSALQ